MLDHLSTLFPARQREPRRKLMRLQTFSMYPARRADRCIHRPVPQPVAAEHKRQYELVYGVSCFLADKGTVPYSDVRFQQMAMPDFMAQRRREAAIRCDPFSTLRHSRQSRDNVAHVATCRTLGKRTSGVNTLGLHGVDNRIRALRTRISPRVVTTRLFNASALHRAEPFTMTVTSYYGTIRDRRRTFGIWQPA